MHQAEPTDELLRQQALATMPPDSFVAELAQRSPPPAEWWDEESPFEESFNAAPPNSNFDGISLSPYFCDNCSRGIQSPGYCRACRLKPVSVLASAVPTILLAVAAVAAILCWANEWGTH